MEKNIEPVDHSSDLLSCLQAFVAVVESNGFSAAARRLRTTRSTVSKQVARLEGEWGVKLLRRTTRSVSLTEPGQLAFEYAREIPKLAALAREAAASQSRTPRGTLRVTASVSYGQNVLVPLLPDFCERHPRVDVELHLLDRIVDLVDEGFDLAIRLSDRLPEGAVAQRIGEVRYRLCASPQLAGIGGVQEPGDLEALPALRLAGRGAKEAWILSRGQERARVNGNGRARANTSDALMELAISGLGVALLPDYVHREAMDRGALVELLPEWKVEGPYGDAVWAVRSERQALPKAAALVDFLAKALGASRGSAPGADQAGARADCDSPP